MVDPSNIFMAGWFSGLLVSLLIGWVIVFPRDDNYKKLLRETKYLLDRNDGIITPTDLALKAEISPSKSKKFLKKLAQQLEAEVEVDESGAIYYKFVVAETVNHNLLEGSESKKLLRETRYLVDRNNGIVTPTDLALRGEISPDKSKKFLEKLAQQLKTETEVDETGAVYYKFALAEAINNKLIKSEVPFKDTIPKQISDS